MRAKKSDGKGEEEDERIWRERKKSRVIQKGIYKKERERVYVR